MHEGVLAARGEEGPAPAARRGVVELRDREAREPRAMLDGRDPLRPAGQVPHDGLRITADRLFETAYNIFRKFSNRNKSWLNPRKETIPIRAREP